MSLSTVRADLTEAFAATGVAAYGTVPAAPQFPCYVIGFPDRVERHATIAGHRRYDFAVGAWVSLSDIDAAQDTLDDLVSNLDAVETYVSTVWRALDVSEVNGFRQEQAGDIPAITANILVTLIAP